MTREEESRFYVIFPAFRRLGRADSMYVYHYILASESDFLLEAFPDEYQLCFYSVLNSRPLALKPATIPLHHGGSLHVQNQQLFHNGEATARRYWERMGMISITQNKKEMLSPTTEERHAIKHWLYLYHQDHPHL